MGPNSNHLLLCLPRWLTGPGLSLVTMTSLRRGLSSGPLLSDLQTSKLEGLTRSTVACGAKHYAHLLLDLSPFVPILWKRELSRRLSHLPKVSELV